jgi:ubiquinone/menaquinone biosynthesis C-methylase UbiE
MVYTVDPEQAETRALHNLVDFNDKDVLEIGCGDGRLTWRYADAAASVLALDPKVSEIALAQAATPEPLRSRVTFRVASLLTCDLPPASFDIVLFGLSL